MGMAVFNQLLQMNLIGIYGILLAFVVRLLLRRAGSRYCYALWIVVFLNLALPTVLTGRFSLIPKQLYQVGLAQIDGSAYEPGTGNGLNALINETGEQDTAEAGNDSSLTGETDGQGTAESGYNSSLMGEDSNALQNSTANTGYYDLRNGAVDKVVDMTSDVALDAATGGSNNAEGFFVFIMSGVSEISEQAWNQAASAFGGETILIRCMLTVWILVMLILFAMEGVQYQRTRRHLKSLPCTGTDEANHAVTLDGLETPVLFGFLHPTIYLPEQLKEEERDYILRHELYHRRRKDHIVKAAALSISIVYWYNPLVWAAFHCFGIDMELSCDEAVLLHADTDIRKAYAGSLLKYGALQNHYVLTSLTFGEPGLKVRVKHVLQFQKRGVIITIVAVLAIALLAVGLLVRPAMEAETSETLSGEEQGALFQQEQTELTEELTQDAETEQGLKPSDGADESDDPLAHTADQVQYFAAVLDELDEEDYCQILTIHGYSVLLLAEGTYDTSWERGTDHGTIAAEVYFPTMQLCISSMGTAYPLRYSAEGIYVEWNTGIYTIYTLEEERGELTTESRALNGGEWDTLYDIPFVMKKELLEETGISEEQLQTWAAEVAETNAADNQNTMTVEKLASVLMSGEIASYDYGICENAVLREPADDPETCYYIFYDLEYGGIDYRLWVQCTRGSEEDVVNSVSLERTTTGIPYVLYSLDEDGSARTVNVTGLYTFLSEAGIEDYLISIDLPDGYTFGDWDEDIGYGSDSSASLSGGVLIAPAAYELQEGYERYMLAADWQYYAGFFALIEEGSWFWKGDTLEPGIFQENHMECTYVEMLEGTAKTAYLLDVQYDLYTAAGQAALEESGADLNMVDTVSEYWYIIYVDDGVGATTGYCLGLAQNLFTKEEAVAIAQSVVFAE